MATRAALLLLLLAAANAAEFTVSLSDKALVSIAHIALDSQGNTYVAGNRSRIYGQLAPQAFAAKVDPLGAVQFSFTIDGATATAIAVDPQGAILLTGEGFLARIAADGSKLLTSTRIDGSPRAIAIAPNGDIVIAGSTTSATFPDNLRVSAYPPLGGNIGARPAAFFQKFDPLLTRVLTSGYLAGRAVSCGGGSGCDFGSHGASFSAIGFDAQQNIYLAGNADLLDLPTTPTALLPKGIGAFVAKVSPDGARLLYATYIGPTQRPSNPATNPASTITALSVDPAGNATIVGQTQDPLFPATPGALQTQYSGYTQGPFFPLSGNWDGFAARLNPSGSAMLWATYLGDIANSEKFESLSVDPSGTLWISGTSTRDRVESTILLALDNQGRRVLHSSSYAARWGNLSKIDANGLLHLGGDAGLLTTLRPATPLSPRILGLTGAFSQLTSEISPGQIVSLSGPGIGPDAPVTHAFTDGQPAPLTLGGTQLFFNGQPAPLLYVSKDQINAVVPNSLPSGQPVSIRTNTTTLPFIASLAPSTPQLLSPDPWAHFGVPNSPSAPARPGEVLSVWLTGTGADTPAGAVADGPRQTNCCQLRNLTTGAPVEVVYAGDVPGFLTALQQVNFRAPATSSAIEIVTPGNRVVSVSVLVFSVPPN